MLFEKKDRKVKAGEKCQGGAAGGRNYETCDISAIE
jgi:hypothetical protein